MNINNLQTKADRILLQQFSPAAVLIDAQGDIKYINDSTGKYLDISSDKTNLNIHMMAHKKLQHHLSDAVNKLREQLAPFIT